MHGSMEPRASGALEKGGTHEIRYNLGTARRLLPLLRRIVRDVLQLRRQMALLAPEQVRLDRDRHTLDWPQRQRRYQLHEETATLEQQHKGTLAELERLGVVLVSPLTGLVGLPTRINRKPALFSWKPDEDSLRFWLFPGESIRRPIPDNWKEFGELRISLKK